MDLIDREQALGCFWIYEDGDETEMPAYDRLQALPIVAEVEDCISRQAATDKMLQLVQDRYAWQKDALEYVRGVNAAIGAIKNLPTAQPRSTMGQVNVTVQSTNDCISRQDAIDALWKALFEYEDKTEKQFQESEDLDVADWIMHRNFVQNMNDIDRQTILALPSAQPEVKEIGYVECANAMLKMWIDNVVTDGEYNRIMDKLNKYWGKVNA